MATANLFTTLIMANDKYSLTWQSYNSHFQGVLGNLFRTSESSDVTLVCDDQVKFKAHKFILKSCSPVFESILNETNDDSKSVVYLRGVNQLELKPILNFIYSGQASFYQERIRDFLKIGRDLQIIEIKEVPEEDEMADIRENVAEKPHQDVISGEDDKSVDENEFTSSFDSYETNQQICVPSNTSQCPQCDAVFANKHNMLRHVTSKHEGVKYPCSQCDYKATEQSKLKRHIESVHEGMKYPCSQCDYKATTQSNLKRHTDSKHKC